MDALRATVARVQSTVLDHGFYIFYRKLSTAQTCPILDFLQCQDKPHTTTTAIMSEAPCQSKHAINIRHLEQSSVGQQQSAENSLHGKDMEWTGDHAQLFSQKSC